MACCSLRLSSSSAARQRPAAAAGVTRTTSIFNYDSTEIGRAVTKVALALNSFIQKTHRTRSREQVQPLYRGKPGKARLGPIPGRPASRSPIADASARVRAPALLAACWAAREGLAKKPVLELMVLPLDWKVGPRTPLAEPPKGTPEPGREEGIEERAEERDISKKFQGLHAISTIVNFKKNKALSAARGGAGVQLPSG
jgi:hypothetical protein